MRKLIFVLFALLLCAPADAARRRVHAQSSAAPVCVVNDPELGEWMVANDVRSLWMLPPWLIKAHALPYAPIDIDRTWSDRRRLYFAIANGFEPDSAALAGMGFDPSAFWGHAHPINTRFPD